LCTTRPRSAGDPAYRLYIRGLERRRAGSVRESLFGPNGRRDPRTRPLDPPQHHREVRTGEIGPTGAGVRGRFRGDSGITPAPIRNRGPFPADRKVANRQTAGGGKYDRGSSAAARRVTVMWAI